MELQRFNFHGRNRHIQLSLSGGRTPQGFSSVKIQSQVAAQQLVTEIAPHFARDPNALGAARAILLQLGQSAGLDARAIAGQLTTALAYKKISAFAEIEKANLHTSTQTATPESASSSKNQPALAKSSHGQADNNTVHSGASENKTTTDVPIDQQECRSDPVSMLTGEEILKLTDFELSGLLMLNWHRLYRSSKSLVNLGLGFGWRHSFSLQLLSKFTPPPKVGPKQPGTYWLELIDEEGRAHAFDMVKRGQTCYQLSSGWSLHHQADGRQILIKPDDSHYAFKKVDENWLLESITDHKGVYIGLFYDDQYRLARVTCSQTRGILLQYKNKHLIAIRGYVLDDKGTRQVSKQPLATYTYNDANQLISATDAQQSTEHYYYSAHNLLLKRTRASGFSHHFEWQGENQQAKCVKQWGDDGHYHYRFEYHEDHTTCQDSFGKIETFYHNSAGLLSCYIDTLGNQTRYQYNQYGQKTHIVAANGATTYFAYNHLGQLVSVIDSLGAKTQYGYNRFGQRVLTVDPLGQKTERRFDAIGRLLAIEFPDGTSHTYKYDDFGNLNHEVNRQGIVSRYHRDKHGDLLAVQKGEQLTRFSYDELGRLSATLNADGLLTQFTRNDKGLIICQSQSHQASQKTVEPGLQTVAKTFFHYDEAGRLVSIEDPLGHITRYEFEGLAQPAAAVMPDGSWLAYHYDRERNLTGIERSDGAHFHLQYDGQENPIKLIGFDGREQVFEYDSCHQLISVSDSGRRYVKLKRDLAGRVTSQQAVAIDDQGHSQSVQNHYQYDALNRVIKAFNGDSHINLSYHKNGQISQLNHNTGHVRYRYNNLGQCVGLQVESNASESGADLHLEYDYDTQGRVNEIRFNSSAAGQTQCISLAQYHYTLSGQLSRAQLGNGVCLNQHFDAFGRLAEQQWQKPATLLLNRRYQYDSSHRLTQVLSDSEHTSLSPDCPSQQYSETRHFSYNELSQLVKEQCFSTHPFDELSGQLDSNKQFEQGYHWDAFGNPMSPHSPQAETVKTPLRPTENVTRTVTQASHDTVKVNQDRLLHASGCDYFYDDSGNQTRSWGAGLDQQRQFDGLNQLTQVNHNGQLCHYHYDAFGRRVSKTTEAEHTDFIWSSPYVQGSQLLGEYTQNHFIWYVFIPGTFTPVALIKGQEVYYYHVDQLDTAQYLSDQQGHIVWQNDNNAFGEPQRGTASATRLNICVDSMPDSNKTSDNKTCGITSLLSNPIRFAGQYFDTESQLHYNHYRYYDPSQQRFINQDPIGLVGGINHYQYAPNPVNWIDPWGLLCKEGQDKLSAMLGTLVGNGIDQATKDKILKSAIDSAPITDPEGKLKVQKPDGVNKLNYVYTAESMDEVNNTITIRRKIGEETKEMELSTEEFAGMHEFDGRVVNEEWASKGRIKENTARTLVTAKKKENSETTYLLKPEEKEALQPERDARDEAMNERDKFARKTDGYNKQIPKVNAQSAKIGEKAADMAVTATYPGYERIHPSCLDESTSVSGNFDMVYQNANGDVIIVEAKGGKSPLCKKQIGKFDYQQGTPEYAEAITKSMEKNEQVNGKTDRAAAFAIKEAIDDGNDVKYLHIETPITKTSTGSAVSEVKISEFDIGSSKYIG